MDNDHALASPDSAAAADPPAPATGEMIGPDVQPFTASFSGKAYAHWFDPNGADGLPTTLDEFQKVADHTNGQLRTQLGVEGTAAVADFHIVGRPDVGGPVWRSRWRVPMRLHGPSLTPGASNGVGYPSMTDLTLLLWPLTDRLQLTSDLTVPGQPYRTELADLIAALVLWRTWTTALCLDTGQADPTSAGFRRVWGTPNAQPRDDCPGIGDRLPVVGFQPEQLAFTPIGAQIEDDKIPYRWDEDEEARRVACYSFQVPKGSPRQPGLWLVFGDYTRKVSYCTDNPDGGWRSRWDDPDEPCPEFTPLPWPKEQAVIIESGGTAWTLGSEPPPPIPEDELPPGLVRGVASRSGGVASP